LFTDFSKILGLMDWSDDDVNNTIANINNNNK